MSGLKLSTPAKVELVAWSGDVSQLSARLGICESILTDQLREIARP